MRNPRLFSIAQRVAEESVQLRPAARDKRIGEENDLFADRRTDLYSVENRRTVAAADPQEIQPAAKAGEHGPRA